MTGGAASHGDNHNNIANDDDDDDTNMDALLDDDIPDIILLDSRGQPEEPASPADDAHVASALLNSFDPLATPNVFGAMAGMVISSNPTPEQQAVLNGRSILRARGVPAQQLDYIVMPNMSTAGVRSTHLSATGQPSSFAQSIVNIGPVQPGNNFMGRLHQASSNRNMVARKLAPTVNADAQLSNHLSEIVSPAPPPQQQGGSAEPVAVAPLSLPETLLHNNAPTGTSANVNSFWRQGVLVAPLPQPTLPNPNYKDDRTPKPLAGTTTAGRPKKSVAPSPKWYHALPEQTMRHAKLKVGQLFSVLTFLPIINMMGHLASHGSGETMPLYDSTHHLQAVSITLYRIESNRGGTSGVG